MKTAIIIPARYASTRLPGKPLAMIAGRSMLSRVVAIARVAARKDVENISIYVATDDARIADHCREIGVESLLTPAECATGTDRIIAAANQLREQPDFILNFQGDAPLTPPGLLSALIDGFAKEPCDIVTPVTQLSWPALDDLREKKKVTPFSGTTATFNLETGRALWFSKNIIPALRAEDKARTKGDMSPVFRHVGLYGYSPAGLGKYSQLPKSLWEDCEGLEQLRALDHGLYMRCIVYDYQGWPSSSGVDSPEDIVRAEALIAKHGEIPGLWEGA